MSNEANHGGQWAIALLHSERDPEQYPCKDYKEVLKRAEEFLKKNQPSPGERIGVITGQISSHDAGKEAETIHKWSTYFSDQLEFSFRE